MHLHSRKIEGFCCFFKIANVKPLYQPTVAKKDMTKDPVNQDIKKEAQVCYTPFSLTRNIKLSAVIFLLSSPEAYGKNLNFACKINLFPGNKNGAYGIRTSWSTLRSGPRRTEVWAPKRCWPRAPSSMPCLAVKLNM